MAPSIAPLEPSADLIAPGAHTAPAPAVPAHPEPAAAATPGPIPEPLSAPKRLLIEEIGNTGRFVYKLLDPVSGDVIVQLPREEVVRLAEMDSYAAGAVISTQA